MRITQNMMSNVFIGNLRKQTEAMLQRNEQISTQKRINRPSDDPAGMARVLDGRSTLAASAQYTDNITQGTSRLEFGESILGAIDDLVQQARRTAEENSGADVPAEARALAAANVKGIYDQLMAMANSKYGDRYMFSGDETGTAPFTRDASYTATYNGDAGSFRIPIADGVEVTIDADGRNYFQNGANGGVDIFDEVRDLITGLENPNTTAGTAQIQATIDPLTDAHAQIMNKRSEYGPKLARLQATREHWANLKSAVQGAIGRDEDADVAQAIIELKNLQVAYESTLAAASSILQQSLVNFLK
ncbi:MAG TPA: flagellar hook-associated protein FlgL [Desulfobacterales bacterium]|nr:flagellar hook-associated protein FlgL [Desulfobacterales bacterium]